MEQLNKLIKELCLNKLINLHIESDFQCINDKQRNDPLFDWPTETVKHEPKTTMGIFKAKFFMWKQWTFPEELVMSND